ncbi:hypothetical protein [Tenacibaculum agarivorans]|uniref:hypothetical protein n=1 Tax=Tenacibaculum agarivorans TaxID=1908389 RepID=UPI00094BBF59|nr:hypothetical protein [Tenacibaculum agarivorans]
MEKKFINFKEISEKLQEKIDLNASNIAPEEYLYFCAMESNTILEFYEKIEKNPQYSLFKLEGTTQGIEHKGKIYLFKDYIPRRHQVLIWNMLALDNEQDMEHER